MHPTTGNRLILVALIGALVYWGHGLHQASRGMPGGMVAKAVAGERIRGEHFSLEPSAPAHPVCKGFQWEELPSSGNQPRAYRAQVPGGWLIATCTEPHGGAGVHTVFVPDLYYWWELR